MAADAQAAFICYSSKDVEWVRKLALDLREGGAQVWMDHLDIRPGQKWRRTIEAALNNCPRMLLVLSPSAVESDEVEAEYSFALEGRKEIIPVLCKDCKVPYRLLTLQRADFRADYEGGLHRLLGVLGTVHAANPRAATGENLSEGDNRTARREKLEQERSAEVEEELQSRHQTAKQPRLQEQRLAALNAYRQKQERKAREETARRKEPEGRSQVTEGDRLEPRGDSPSGRVKFLIGLGAVLIVLIAIWFFTDWRVNQSWWKFWIAVMIAELVYVVIVKVVKFIRPRQV